VSSYQAAGLQPLRPAACLASLPLPPAPCGGNCCVWMLALGSFGGRLLKGKTDAPDRDRPQVYALWLFAGFLYA